MQWRAAIDNWLHEAPSAIRKKNWALATNDAATLTNGQPVRQALLAAGWNIRVLLSPEHGLQATGPDGQQQPHGIDALTRLPVYSLYHEHQTWQPDPSWLQNIDGILFDIPDIGCRYYTYLWTLSHLMEYCAISGTPLVVLDRPNPLGGSAELVQGPMLNEALCASFIGRWAMPIVHSCTLGELAKYFASTRLPKLPLQVVPCPDAHAAVAGLYQHPRLFRPTSPAIQHWHTAQLYPGTCLAEGLNLNEGRGTPAPFEQWGAPWINASIWAEHLQPAWPHLQFRTVQYVPQWGRYAGQVCHGLRISAVAKPFQAVSLGIAMITSLLATHGTRLQPAPYPTLANPDGNRHLDFLLGIPQAWEALQKGTLTTQLSPQAWCEKLSAHLIYPRKPNW